MSFLTFFDKNNAFDPKSVPDLALWLDASDVATLTKDGSNLVSQWADKSGNGQHRTQTVAGRYPTYVASCPINGKPGIYFSADPQLLGENASTINSRGNLTIFSVFRYEAHSNWGTVFQLAQSVSDGQGAPGLSFENTINNQLIVYNSTLTLTGKIVLNTGTGIVGTNNIAMYRRTGGTNGSGGTVNLECRGGINTSASGTQVWTSFMGNNYFIGRQGFSSGTTRSMIGYVSEHLCYQRALSAAEQNQVWAYLRAKWAI